MLTLLASKSITRKKKLSGLMHSSKQKAMTKVAVILFCRHLPLINYFPGVPSLQRILFLNFRSM